MKNNAKPKQQKNLRATDRLYVEPFIDRFNRKVYNMT